MIKGILLVNNHGKPRLVKFYEDVPFDQQTSLIHKLYKAVSRRPESVCNFIDDSDIWPSPHTKIIYRHYATLYFVFVVDSSESELGILDLVQVFVECLDKFFENVCELDLIFHSDKVHYILDEIILGGMVLEINKDDVVQTVEALNRFAKDNSKRS